MPRDIRSPTRTRVLTRPLSAEKGIEERDYEFSFDLFEEVVPEVRTRSPQIHARYVLTRTPASV